MHDAKDTATELRDHLVGPGEGGVLGVWRHMVRSGKGGLKRPGWIALWKEIEPGDTVVILSLDRLGRNLVEVVMTVDKMRKRGVGLKVLNGDIDTATATGRMLLGIFATLADYERALINERTRNGLAKARERGTVGGRPPKLTKDMVDKAIIRVQGGESAQAVADNYKVHRNTLKRHIDDRRKQIRTETQNAK